MGPQRRSRILLVAAVGAVALGSGACGGAATLGGRDGGNAGHGGAGGRDGGGAGHGGDGGGAGHGGDGGAGHGDAGGAGHGGGGGTGHGGDGGAGHGDAGGVGQAGGASPDGGAGRDGGGDAAQCPPPDAQVAEPPPRGVALDGGVPIDQLAYAMAVARCNYQSRCFGLATYVADRCVDAIVNQGRWGYPVCASGGSDCESEIAAFAFPSAALLRAVGAGVIHYSPEREGECIAALLTQGCASPELKENIHACSGVFTCPAGGPGTGDGGATDGAVADGGASDAGATCAQLTSLGNLEFWTCATDDDCVGAPAPQGPDCVQGLCAASRCGITFDGCTSYAAAGQACASNAESLVDPGAVPQQMCAPGLNCQGALRPGYGTCVVPVGVGGPCTDNASCEIGLACACGACEIPPSSGPCVNGLCEVGVAYCDLASNSCRPVLQEGASCPAPHSCAAGLFCDDGVCKAS